MVTIDCICPPKADGGARHPDGDTVTLRERLDFRAALTARNTIVLLKTEDPDASAAEVLAALTEMYLLLGVEAWSIVDAKNHPVAVSKAAVRELLLGNPDAAMTVGDAADALYSQAVILPLLARAQTSSPRTRTGGSTSATKRSSAKRPTPLRRSSTTTTPTVATEATSDSLDGDFSSSLSSRSAV